MNTERVTEQELEEAWRRYDAAIAKLNRDFNRDMRAIAVGVAVILGLYIPAKICLLTTGYDPLHKNNIETLFDWSDRNE